MGQFFNRHITIICLLISLAAYSQDKVTGINSDWTSKAGNYTFLENSYSIVKAAGMELLDDESVSIAEDLIDFAFTFEGTRYRCGGKTPAGFDCSGFTSYVFTQFGYKLNADSRSQFLQGVAVDNNMDVLPGDLLFFGGRGAGSTIGHVGIAIEVDYETGSIMFIHSATSGGVKTDYTTDPYYAKRYKGARRIIGVD